MDIREIIDVLRENKSVDAFEINKTHKQSRELFYVLKKLETNRAVDYEDIKVNIYHDEDDMRGRANFSINSGDDIKSLKEKISKAIEISKASLNPFYELAKKREYTVENIDEVDLNQIALKTADAVYSQDIYDDGWINSTEIFVDRIDSWFYNSNGVDLSETRYMLSIEVIPTWRGKDEEVELYKYYESNEFDYKKIKDEVREILEDARDRAQAVPLPDIKNDTKILISGEMAESLLDFYTSELDYSAIKTNVSHYKIGDVISDSSFDINLKAQVPGSALSKKFDNNGVVLKDKKIVKNGKVVDYHGNIMYGYYMGVKDISGVFGIGEIIPYKTVSEDEIRNCPYLEIISFSSPQIDKYSGYFGGEVRLGRYFDGEKIIPVTGFSISGNLYDDIKKVEFSQETSVYKSYSGPKYLIFKDVKANK